MTAMLEAPSGVPGLGAVPWGSHHCHFYDSREDLVDTLVPYFKAGLDHNEACLWVTSEPFSAVDARAALAAHVPDLSERERRGQIEIIDHGDWYLRTGQTDAHATLDGWIRRERAALAEGYQGLRLTGNTYWLERGDWDSFVGYEQLVNESFRQHRIIGLCSYCFQRCTARDVLDVVGNHQLALARRNGTWQVVESSALKLAREDLQRVRESAEALRESDRRKDEFIAMLGHELRNPLAPITTAVQLMRLRGAADSYGKELETIARQSRHLTRLVDDLLDVSRIARGKVDLRRAPTELAEIVARAVEVTTPLLEQRRQELQIDVPARGLVVDADTDRLTQALSNVLTNAARYTPVHGRVSIRASSAPGQVRLVVTDNGPGIPEDLLPHVFELFVQGTRSIARKEGGLGLGLPIVKSLIELHQGSVSVQSRAGEGTRVTITLPAMTAASPAPSPGTAANATGLRVLVVDDNEDAAILLAEALQMAGYETVVAHDGPTALQQASETPPDIAVLDIGLPVMDGYELAGKLKALPRNSGVQMIALTGYGTADDRSRAARAGFAHHLVKPVDLVALLQVLDRLRSN